MATRKKAKRQKKPAKRPVVRGKAAAVRKKKAAKKPAPRRAQPRKAPVVRAPSRSAMPAAPAPAPAPMPGEERIGTVTHYYGHLSVAAVRMESGSLRVGDMIHVVGHTSDFRQRVESLQIEHESVSEVRAGQEVGLKVTSHAREHDVVYKTAS